MCALFKICIFGFQKSGPTYEVHCKNFFSNYSRLVRFPKMNVSVFDQNLNFKFPKVLLPNTLSEEISSADSLGWSAFQDSNFAWTSMSKIHWFIKANLQLKIFRKCSSQTHSLKKFLQQLLQVGLVSWNWFYLKFQRRFNQLMESKQ